MFLWKWYLGRPNVALGADVYKQRLWLISILTAAVVTIETETELEGDSVIDMNNSNVIKCLTYLGATPFFLSILVSLTSKTFLGVEAVQWFLSYGLVILSFMAGTLWGQVLNQKGHIKTIAVATNAITLAAWIIFLLGASSLAVLVVALGFFGLYLLEAMLMKPLKRPDYYLSLRRNVTVLVVLAHGVLFWLL